MMAVEGPRIRASSAKRGRASLCSLFPERADEVLARCESSNEITRDTPGHGWIPLEVENEFVSAMVEVLGADQARRVVVNAVSAELKSEGSIISGLYGSTIRLFGLTPNALGKAVPPSFGLVYRGLGDLRYRKLGQNHCQFELDSIPPTAQQLETYFIALSGIFDALPILCELDGESTYHRDAPDRARWQVSWRPGK